ncbi:hypothetical protein BC828DRAFT_385791 [Blastocladiella britannica]|nr:hypothetical protein BC828DRAFT_385791 [Blastocladiella britannica]
MAKPPYHALVVAVLAAVIATTAAASPTPTPSSPPLSPSSSSSSPLPDSLADSVWTPALQTTLIALSLPPSIFLLAVNFRGLHLKLSAPRAPPPVVRLWAAQCVAAVCNLANQVFFLVLATVPARSFGGTNACYLVSGVADAFYILFQIAATGVLIVRATTLVPRRVEAYVWAHRRRVISNRRLSAAESMARPASYASLPGDMDVGPAHGLGAARGGSSASLLATRERRGGSGDGGLSSSSTLGEVPPVPPLAVRLRSCLVRMHAVLWTRSAVRLGFAFLLVVGLVPIVLSIILGGTTPGALGQDSLDTGDGLCAVGFAKSLNVAGKSVLAVLYTALGIAFAWPLRAHLLAASSAGSRGVSPARRAGANADVNVGANANANANGDANVIGNGNGGNANGTDGAVAVVVDRLSTGAAPPPRRPLPPSASSASARALRRVMRDVAFRVSAAVATYLFTAVLSLVGVFGDAKGATIAFTVQNMAALVAATVAIRAHKYDGSSHGAGAHERMVERLRLRKKPRNNNNNNNNNNNGGNLQPGANGREFLPGAGGPRSGDFDGGATTIPVTRTHSVRGRSALPRAYEDPARHVGRRGNAGDSTTVAIASAAGNSGDGDMTGTCIEPYATLDLAPAHVGDDEEVATSVSVSHAPAPPRPEAARLRALASIAASSSDYDLSTVPGGGRASVSLRTFESDAPVSAAAASGMLPPGTPDPVLLHLALMDPVAQSPDPYSAAALVAVAAAAYPDLVQPHMIAASRPTSFHTGVLSSTTDSLLLNAWIPPAPAPIPASAIVGLRRPPSSSSTFDPAYWPHPSPIPVGHLVPHRYSMDFVHDLDAVVDDDQGDAVTPVLSPEPEIALGPGTSFA